MTIMIVVYRVFICPICGEKVFAELNEDIKEGVDKWPLKIIYTHKDHKCILYLDARLYVAKVVPYEDREGKGQ